MDVLMTHVMGIIIALSPTLRQFISLSLQVMLSRDQILVSVYTSFSKICIYSQYAVCLGRNHLGI